MTRQELIEAIVESAPKVNFLGPRGLYTTVGAAARDPKRFGKIEKFMDQADYFNTPQSVANISKRAKEALGPRPHHLQAWKQIPLSYKVKRFKDYVTNPKVRSRGLDYAIKQGLGMALGEEEKERYVPRAVLKKRAEMEARKKAKQEKREKEREEMKKKYPGGTGWRKSRAAGWKEGDKWEPSKKPWEK